LLGVVGFIYGRHFFSKSGTMRLEIWVDGGTLLLNGKPVKYDFQPGADFMTVSVELSPGNHKLQFTRDGYQPFSTEVTVKSNEEQTIIIRPQKVFGPPPKGPP
jgi:hypothetical protein